MQSLGQPLFWILWRKWTNKPAWWILECVLRCVYYSPYLGLRVIEIVLALFLPYPRILQKSGYPPSHQVCFFVSFPSFLLINLSEQSEYQWRLLLPPALQISRRTTPSTQFICNRNVKISWSSFLYSWKATSSSPLYPKNASGPSQSVYLLLKVIISAIVASTLSSDGRRRQ